MKIDLLSPVPEPTESDIQHAAYLLWIENGRPEGRDLDHWLAAKELLCHRHGRSPTPARRRPRVSVRAAAPGKN